MKLWLLLAPAGVALATLALLSGPESSCNGSDTVTIGFDVAVLVAAVSALATVIAAIVLRRPWPLLAAILIAIAGWILVVNVVGDCMA